MIARVFKFRRHINSLLVPRKPVKVNNLAHGKAQPFVSPFHMLIMLVPYTIHVRAISLRNCLHASLMRASILVCMYLTPASASHTCQRGCGRRDTILLDPYNLVIIPGLGFSQPSDRPAGSQSAPMHTLRPDFFLETVYSRPCSSFLSASRPSLDTGRKSLCERGETVLFAGDGVSCAPWRQRHGAASGCDDARLSGACAASERADAAGCCRAVGSAEDDR